jgi:hypothetical protein
MYRAVTGRMSPRPFLVRSVNPTNRARPALVLPVASNRSSSCECLGSGATLGPATNRASISAMDMPCFWHFARFPSSQSNPLTRRFISVSTIQTYILLCQTGALPTSALAFVPASFLACARSFCFCPRDVQVAQRLNCNSGNDIYEHQAHANPGLPGQPRRPFHHAHAQPDHARSPFVTIAEVFSAIFSGRPALLTRGSSECLCGLALYSPRR